MSGAISAVGVSSIMPSTKPEAAEPVGRDTKNDHDKDDVGGASAAASAPKPTVNTQGQTIGTVLNTKA